MAATRKRKSPRTPTKSKKAKAEEEDKSEDDQKAEEVEGKKSENSPVGDEKTAASETLKSLGNTPDGEGESKDESTDDASPPKAVCEDGNCGSDESDQAKAATKEGKAQPSSGGPTPSKTTAAAHPEPRPKTQPSASAPVATTPRQTQSGVPSGAPAAVQADATVEEKGEVSSLYVGRVIGRGGEMIRDLQARSGCRIDVDQNVPQGAPRVITYRGTRSAIAFARRLVATLCTEKGKDAELPIGQAVMRKVQVPGTVIGKIIGRGGEMIRKLQSESQAKIQVDHSGAGMDANHRQVTITGTNESVVKAEEMIMFLCANPAVDAMQALHMLIRDKTQARGVWGSGPPYPNLPNQGQGMPEDGAMGGGHQGGGAYGQSSGSHGGYDGHQDNRYGPSGGGGGGGSSGGMGADMFPCAKMHMGRVIGQKGITINDLQKRSGCDIQINQNVQPGEDCEISLKGSREGIEMAKQMLRDIIDLGSNHPYAGGHGQFGSSQRGGQQGYPQQSYQGGYAQGHQQPQMYSHQQYGMPQQQYGGQPMYQQQQPYQPQQGQYGMQPGVPQAQPSPWRAATAADGQVYYYNQITQETQWDRPAGM